MAKAVYLVHYKQPRGHIRHAVRWLEAPAGAIRKLYRNLNTQPIDHRAKAQSIEFVLVRTWHGRDGGFERKLKDQKHHSRLCPPRQHAPEPFPEQDQSVTPRAHGQGTTPCVHGASSPTVPP